MIHGVLLASFYSIQQNACATIRLRHRWQSTDTFYKITADKKLAHWKQTFYANIGIMF